MTVAGSLVQAVSTLYAEHKLFVFAVALAASCSAYGTALGFYRLFLHPLAGLPGPRLTALTYWVEVYYDCLVPGGGRFIWQYKKWHQQYGPIVRINPDEVHFDDSAFYDTLYSTSKPLDKLQKLNHRFDAPGSLVSTVKHDTHRQRRSAVNPFFSRRKITEHAPHIQEHMSKLCQRLESEYRGTGQIIQMNHMWGSFTSDIIVQYAFEQPYNFILNPGFRSSFVDGLYYLVDPVHVVEHFPWVMTMMKSMPDALTRKMSPGVGIVNDWQAQLKEQIGFILQAWNKQTDSDNPKTAGETDKVGDSIFAALLQSGLPPEDLSLLRLKDEAISVVGGGLETTMRALVVASYHIIANPPIYQNLKQELARAIPDPLDVPDVNALYRLPYLTICVEEALRLTYGVSQRSIRTCPDPIAYHDYVLPPRTPVSMDTYSVLHDETIFQASHSFKPERWLNNPKAADGRPLSAYMVAFGRGSRSCVGRELAYAELYIGLANAFRRFDWELYETDVDAVQLDRELFVPRPKVGTKGVRVVCR